MKQRSVFWDNYKGVLIFLVVFGHFIYAYANKVDGSLAQHIYDFIYTFHMPAFVFSTGYFSKSERSRSGESLVKLLLYYLVFNTLMLCFAAGYLGRSIKLLTPYYSYWYILSVVMWRALIGKVDNIRGLVVLSAVLTLALGFSSEFSNLLALRRTVGFFVFFAAGYRMDRQKVDAFLARRKPLGMVLCVIPTIAAAAAAWWAVQKFGITDSMAMMSSYRGADDLLLRVLLLAIAAAAIICMMLVIPDRKIPLLSQIGKNSLLIYLAHRFVTIVYYTDLFPAKTYTGKYLLYAFGAAALTCAVLGNEHLNVGVAKIFDKAAAAIADRSSKYGAALKTVILLGFIVLLFVNGME